MPLVNDSLLCPSGATHPDYASHQICEPAAVASPLPLAIELHDGNVILHQQHWNVVRTIRTGERIADAQWASPVSMAMRLPDSR